MPTDETPPTAAPPTVPTKADDASRVGWFLTAITSVVVIVGLGVINYVTGSRPRSVPTPATPVEPLVEVLPDNPPPIVLRPSDGPADDPRALGPGIQVADPRVTPPTFR